MEDVSPVEIKMHLERLGLLAKVVGDTPVDAMLQQFEHFDAFGVFFEPTGWMRTQGNRRFNKEFLEAAAPLIRFVQAHPEVFGGSPVPESAV